jgi:hypothetical protein
MTHDCPEGIRAQNEQREKLPPRGIALYGDAVVYVEWWDEGCWMASSGDYASLIYFCPWCGQRLDPPPREVKMD